MVRRNSVLVTTNVNGINKTMETFEKFETIQIGEIVEIIPPNKYVFIKKETEVSELESLFSHVIETDLISYHPLSNQRIKLV